MIDELRVKSDGLKVYKLKTINYPLLPPLGGCQLADWGCLPRQT